MESSLSILIIVPFTMEVLFKFAQILSGSEEGEGDFHYIGLEGKMQGRENDYL